MAVHDNYFVATYMKTETTWKWKWKWKWKKMKKKMKKKITRFTTNVLYCYEASLVSYCVNSYCVIVHLNTNIFLFLLSIFLDLIFLFFWFFDNEEACEWGHMTCHILWGHRPRLWEKGLKGWYQSTYI